MSTDGLSFEGMIFAPPRHRPAVIGIENVSLPPSGKPINYAWKFLRNGGLAVLLREIGHSAEEGSAIRRIGQIGTGLAVAALAYELVDSFIDLRSL